VGHEWDSAILGLSPSLVEVEPLNREWTTLINLSTLGDWQALQLTLLISSLFFKRTSNSAPQSRHLNSKIGIGIPHQIHRHVFVG